MNDFELVKDKVDIAEVAGRYTHLRKAGKEFVGLCPIHSEKSPSFRVNKQKQSFYCHGCGVGGDAIELIRIKENVDAYTALEMLAADKGIQLSRQDNEAYYRRKEAQQKQAALVEKANRHAAQKEAVDYLLERGITQESVTRFKIGYGEKNHSIIIPLVDHRNMAIGYAERFIKDPPAGFKGKYRLPSENPDSPIYNELFKKSQFLFNESNARLAVKKDQYLLIFEGQFDTIAADQIGFHASVACMGSSLTLEQGRRILKLAEDDTVIVLVPDKNAVGQASVKQNTDMLRGLNQKLVIKALMLPDRRHESGKEWDMNDFVREGLDRETALGYIQSVEVALLDLMIAQTPDRQLQEEYAREIAVAVENPFTKQIIANHLAEKWSANVEVVDRLLQVKREISIFENTKDIDAMYESFMNKVFSAASNNLTLGYPPLDRVINAGMGIPTGWVLDFLARSSVGKTAFALNVIENAALNLNVGCTFFSFEQQDSDLYPKIAAINHKISQRQVLNEYSNFRHEEYHQKVQTGMKGKLLVYEANRLTLEQMEDVIMTADERYFEAVEQKIVLVDYLGYIKATGGKAKYEGMSEMTAELKQLAKRTKKLFIVLVQTSRKGGDGSEPVSFDDARDSGTIEENADILLGAYRPELKGDLASRELIPILDDYMIQLLKNRNGPQQVTFRMKFDKPEQIIREWREGEKKELERAMHSKMQTFGSEEERIIYLREGRTAI
ncbi:DnaB-like helicase C-terminal domain-containing protein [Paenibacillus filicis]|uniref:DnaB-like helicase C-terminal domain-containing protein n=1 Tax=Paenibacillus filicis TaxID=669464 RepID=A0ABU9DVM0_9BACL